MFLNYFFIFLAMLLCNFIFNFVFELIKAKMQLKQTQQKIDLIYAELVKKLLDLMKKNE